MAMIACPECKREVSDQAPACPACGYPIAAVPVRRHQEIGDDPGIRMLLPVGRSGWAIAAGYLGLLSVLCFPAPLALIAGVLAIREMNRNPKKHGMGRAVFGIIMGAIGSVGLIFWLIVMVASAGGRK